MRTLKLISAVALLAMTSACAGDNFDNIYGGVNGGDSSGDEARFMFANVGNAE